MPVPPAPALCVEYDQVQAKLFRRAGSRRQEVPNLSPKAHTLIRYMAGRSEGEWRARRLHP
ncbi:MAG: hypothetical protein ACR2HV_03535 [Acidimicrobiales bacterium]